MNHRALVAEKRRRIIESGGFAPNAISKITAWRRLVASGIDTGAYAEVPDLLGGPSLLQATGTKRPTANVVNGYPVMTFDGSDDWMQMAVAGASNNNSPRWGWMRWVRPHGVSGLKTLYCAEKGVGASANRLMVYQNSAGIIVDVYENDTNARRATVASGIFTANQWTCLYVAFDGDQTGDAAFRAFDGTSELSPAFSDVGSPTGSVMPSVLVQPTGQHVIGVQNTGTNLRPFDGDYATNGFDFDDTLTADELANLVAFEDPS